MRRRTRVLGWGIGIALLAALALPTALHRVARSREAALEQLLEQLATAAKMYETDWGVYPPGDGEGSGALVRCLQPPHPTGKRYLIISPGMLDERGNVVNPVHRGKPAPLGVVHYRNNVGAGRPASRDGRPPVYNFSSVDLWAAGADGRPFGIPSPEAASGF